MAKTISSVRVFLRTDADRQAIEACRMATGETTAAKALMVAAASYPAARRELETVKAELETLRRQRDSLRDSLRQALDL